MLRTIYVGTYLEVLANCMKATRQELEIERVQRVREFGREKLTRIASID